MIGPKTQKLILGTIILVVPFSGIAICSYILYKGIKRSYLFNKEEKSFRSRVDDVVSQTKQEVNEWKNT